MSLQRWTICLVRGHRWTRIAYPGSEGTGIFLRCRTCRFENHDAGMIARPTGF